MIYPTLPELIKEGKELEISHRTLNADVRIHDTKSGDIIQIPYNAIINKYRDFFDPYIYYVDWEEEECQKYWHNPRLLSFELYGTVEYWSILLFINECASMLDFEPTRVAILDDRYLKDLLNQLLIIDKDQE